ncbi:MAG: BatD family protein [Candidatus Riflebacteria bacterium]|nr:BatD family protein [Candidatus Riflebacteria bacterium]
MRRLITAILMLLAFTGVVFAEDITISTSVDRTEVEFGDTVELTVQIKKPMESSSGSFPNSFNSSGFSFSFNSSSFSSLGGLNDIDFNIESVPGFDIAGRRQSSQSRMVNGVGESVKSIILSLVPQKEGTLVIPAFSMKDKDGKEHSSKPITINVKKVADDPEEEQTATSENDDNKEDNSSVSQNNEAKKENSLFNFYFILGIILVFVIVGVIAFFYFFDYLSKEHKKASEQSIEDAVIVKEEPKVSKEEKKEPVKEEKVEKVEFATIAASLKVQYKEVSPEFYHKYFELFKKACCYRSKALSKDMTYDELLNKCSELAGTNNITQATSRLAHDIEMVMYAGSMPNRQLVAIETDIKEVLNSL